LSIVCISIASNPTSRASANRSAYDSSFGSIEIKVDLWIFVENGAADAVV
jgi:hypothetical protein